MESNGILGVWKNEFGSVMNITEYNNMTGIFSGTYKSDTGATGEYYVTGIADTHPDPSINSQTVSFSISWRAIGPNPPEDGVHWVSAFSGQLQDINGIDTITSTYLLQHNTNPADNWGSTVVATATFVRQTEEG